MGAIIIGAVAAIVCYYAVALIRTRLGVDDSLDVFAVHGVGGVLGTLIIPVLATAGPLAPGLGEVTMGQQAWVQLQGVLAVVGWSVVMTFVIVKAMGFITPLRVKSEAEIEGLDMAAHGERAYHSG